MSSKKEAKLNLFFSDKNFKDKNYKKTKEIYKENTLLTSQKS